MPYFQISKGEIGCLLIHGFGGSPDEMLPLGEYLADQGYSVLGVELPGHGADIKNAGNVKWQDWQEAAKEGYDILARSDVKEIFVIGHSAGSILALLLGATYAAKGIVAIAPFSYVKTWQIKSTTIGSRVLKYLPYGQSHTQSANGVNFPLQLIPTRGLLEVIRLIEFTQSRLPSIQSPVLIIAGKKDLAIPRDAHSYLAERLIHSSVEVNLYREFGHLPMYEKGREKVWGRVKEYIERIHRMRD